MVHFNLEDFWDDVRYYSKRQYGTFARFADKLHYSSRQLYRIAGSKSIDLQLFTQICNDLSIRPSDYFTQEDEDMASDSQRPLFWPSFRASGLPEKSFVPYYGTFRGF